MVPFLLDATKGNIFVNSPCVEGQIYQKKKKYFLIVETMIQSYRVSESNVGYKRIQPLPVFIWNPIRNLFYTKKDILEPKEEAPSLGSPDDPNQPIIPMD